MTPTRPTVARRQRSRARTGALLTLTALGAGAGGFLTPAAMAGANEPRLDTRERAVIHRVNAVRADHGLAPLSFGGRLSRAADRHARRQLRARVLGHQVGGEAPLATRLARAARVQPIGEVVYFSGRGARSAAIVRAWMDSPPHRAVLLHPDFGRAGIGIRTGRGGLYATVDVAAA